ncbi:hypothetical protein [Thiocystis violacea]|uniref:hypothetical protein n=1 Tax=Thiocystis violacea TaxID=13725 RepID=UPI001905481F|nr:hypothetical protein [Thiocystis violacea]MBK1720089.1 hypothetical protein [Thiocystis violacea]
MNRTTVYLPLFPAVADPSAPGSGRLLALAFEGGAQRVRCTHVALTGSLGHLLDQTRRLLGRSSIGAGARFAAWRHRDVFALEQIPNLTDVAATQLGLALGLALTGNAAGGRLLAYGRLEGGMDGRAIVPPADHGPLLALLEHLAPQPQPLLCLIPPPIVVRQEDRRRFIALADRHLHCCIVDSFAIALDVCNHGSVRLPAARPDSC